MTYQHFVHIRFVVTIVAVVVVVLLLLTLSTPTLVTATITATTTSTGTSITNRNSNNDIFKGRIRIDCGSIIDTIDDNGNVWIADKYYTNGRSYSPPSIPVFIPPPSPTTTTIRKRRKSPTTSSSSLSSTNTNTTPNTLTYWLQQQQNQQQSNRNRQNQQQPQNDPLPQQTSVIHRNCRTGTNFSYSIPVYPNRRMLYRVTLHFYELIYKTQRKRSMNVTIQGQQVLSNFDILGTGNALYIHSTEIWINATNNGDDNTPVSNIVSIVIESANKKRRGVQFANYQSLLSAIDIKALDPILIRAGSDSYQDTRGRIWLPDTSFVSRGTILKYPINTFINFNISNTNDDELFRIERYGDFTYTIPIPKRIGTYEIKFYFIELAFTVINQRVFDIFVQYKTVYRNIDLVAFGNNITQTVLVLSYNASIAIFNPNDDPTIIIDFNLIGQNFPKINAIEINLLD